MRPDWLYRQALPQNEEVRDAALRRQGCLTKPTGALGLLEALAVKLAALQGEHKPNLDRVHISIFAADHGVAAEGVSAFPQSVTAEMVRNFARGGAAINVLAHQLGAQLEVINLGTLCELEPLDGVLDLRQGPGAANFTQRAAMDETQCATALDAGYQAVLRAKQSGCGIFIGGEMGIGNTTSAAAIACALLGAAPGLMAGPGSGLDVDGVMRKQEIIMQALELHAPQLEDPYQVLRHLGGFEIAALTGAYIACSQLGLPVLVDGFITSIAALVAIEINPTIRPWLLFSHASAEPGHARVMEALDAEPLFDFGMRLGEASGAAVAVPILRLASALHNDMATFAEAGVSEQHA